MSIRNRIALYGGTFDPVHLGHLAIARKVSELFEIDKVLFVPAQIAPHKVGRDVTPSLHRFAMLTLATQHDTNLLVSTFELESDARNYTVDTLAHFQRTLGGSTDLYFIMGADSWSEISTWREWQRLLTMANHIVVTRPGYKIETPGNEWRDRLIDIRSTTDEGQSLQARAGTERVAIDDQIREGGSGKIFFTDVVMKDISATAIRHLASENKIEELTKLVPEAVAKYIGKYGIYRKSNEAKHDS
jgi:nicotinate-nucleotide adenylyltransferase